MIVCFYSKYSSSSTLFLKRLSHSTPSPEDVRYVCLDKAWVRDRIMRDNRYHISTVPCVLVLREDGIDKYEGNELWEWLNDIEGMEGMGGMDAGDGADMNNDLEPRVKRTVLGEDDGEGRIFDTEDAGGVSRGEDGEGDGAGEERRPVDPVVTQVKPIDVMTLAKRMQEERGGEK